MLALCVVDINLPTHVKCQVVNIFDPAAQMICTATT